jgi:hypothetical protein
MSATLVVRHQVNDYAAWRAVYDELEPVCVEYGCTGQRVLRLPDNANDVLVTHDFPTVEKAGTFAHSQELRAALERAGVAGAPQVEIFDVA